MTPPYDLTAVQARHEAMVRHYMKHDVRVDDHCAFCDRYGSEELVDAHADRAALLAVVTAWQRAFLDLTDDYDRLLARGLTTIGSNMVTPERVRKLTAARQALALVTPAGPAREGE